MAKGILSASWVTARRVRIHGLLLAACLWSIYAANLATPGVLDRNGLVKGTDFLHFYTLGSLALRGRGDLLYNIPAHANLIRRLVPQAGAVMYVPLYGPQVSLLFAPIARLPYGWALAIWLLLNTLIYAACCRSVWKACPSLQRSGWTVLILALAFPGFFHLLAWGQTSGLALAFFTLAFFALRAERRFAAGLALGCLIFKPQLGLAAGILFLVAAEWKVVLGACLSALAQLAAGWIHYGTQVMRLYVHALVHVREFLPAFEPRPYQMHSLRAFWSTLVPWPGIAFGLYVLSAPVILVALIRLWPSRSPLEIRFSALLLATVLVSPHLTVYDLVILAPAFLLLGNWAVAQYLHEDGAKKTESTSPARAVSMLLYVCYPLFLIGPVARFTHLQLSVLALAALFWIAAKPLSASLIRSPAITLNTP